VGNVKVYTNYVVLCKWCPRSRTGFTTSGFKWVMSKSRDSRIIGGIYWLGAENFVMIIDAMLLRPWTGPFRSSGQKSYLHNTNERSGGSVVHPRAGGRGFDPRPHPTKDIIKMVPDASLLGAWHIRSGFSLLSNLIQKKRWIPSGMRGRKWLISVGITCLAIDLK